MNNSIKLIAIAITGFVISYPVSTNTGEASTHPTIQTPVATVVALHDEAEFEYLPPVIVTVIEDEIEIEYIEAN
tara:strand:+ start:537 stop:758 length:222 start_codon:yes stop_codon:yes gene_type:complete